MEGYYTDSYKRVWGNRNIGGNAIVNPENNEINIQIEEDHYLFHIPNGSYRTEYTTSFSELVDTIKNQISIDGYPLEVYLGGNHQDEKFNVLVFRSPENKSITTIGGSFFNDFFKGE